MNDIEIIPGKRYIRYGGKFIQDDNDYENMLMDFAANLTPEHVIETLFTMQIYEISIFPKGQTKADGLICSCNPEMHSISGAWKYTWENKYYLEEK